MERCIETLLDYAIQHHLMSDYDRRYARNRLLALLQEDTYHIYEERIHFQHISEILKCLCDFAVTKGILEDTLRQRDAFDSALMDCVMMRPSQLIACFRSAENEQVATDMFYAFSKDSNYIRMDRIARNISYQVESEFGKLDITINCSKPEKDPKDIANAKNAIQSDYPTCVLCKENEGYYGNESRDGRSNIRMIPIRLNNEHWYFQYSPYVYYNEHCIILSADHTAMKTSRMTFVRLLEFVDVLPHYFLGANADLPIVGGSILSHDHYQGGHYNFAMAQAKAMDEFPCFKRNGIKIERLYWPLSVLRLSGMNKEALVEAADIVLNVWRNYDDEACDIMSHTSEAHNTISTIARKREELFELDLVLRNNRRNETYPLGIFHPHEEIHHIKKENIGIIEVMGLAVLPARLKEELAWIKQKILDHDISHDKDLKAHLDWIDMMEKRYQFTQENIEGILRQEVGEIFLEGLKHCGVFKLDESGKAGMERFMNRIEKELEERAYDN